MAGSVLVSPPYTLTKSRNKQRADKDETARPDAFAQECVILERICSTAERQGSGRSAVGGVGVLASWE